MSLGFKFGSAPGRAAFCVLTALTFSAAAQPSCGPGRQPFTGTFAFQESVQFFETPQNGCAGVGTINGAGRTSLGNASVTSTDCINPVPNSPHNSFNSTNLVFTINGHTLAATYQGTATWTSVEMTSLAISGNVTFVGGTGRFTGAQGTASITGIEYIVAANPPSGFVGVGTLEVAGCVGR